MLSRTLQATMAVAALLGIGCPAMALGPQPEPPDRGVRSDTRDTRKVDPKKRPSPNRSKPVPAGSDAEGRRTAPVERSEEGAPVPPAPSKTTN